MDRDPAVLRRAQLQQARDILWLQRQREDQVVIVGKALLGACRDETQHTICTVLPGSITPPFGFTLHRRGAFVIALKPRGSSPWLDRSHQQKREPGRPHTSDASTHRGASLSIARSSVSGCICTRSMPSVRAFGASIGALTPPAFAQQVSAGCRAYARVQRSSARTSGPETVIARRALVFRRPYRRQLLGKPCMPWRPSVGGHSGHLYISISKRPWRPWRPRRPRKTHV